ncbi:hypothetical protein N7492_009964, partial [Penicillium capsulatum]
MKFSLAAVAGFVSAISAAGLPGAFTLVADGGKTVLTDGQNLWIGTNTSTQEIAVLRGTGQNSPITFTAKDQTPTGWQNLYIIEDSVSPVGLTIPHSGATPKGANTTGFGVNEKGYLTQGGRDWFAIDGYGSEKEVKEIFWYGAHNAEYAAVNLWVKEYK